MKLIEAAGGVLARGKLFAKANAPEIFFISGIALGAGCVVMTARNSIVKLNDANNKIAAIRDKLESDIQYANDHDIKINTGKEKFKLIKTAAWEYTKVYAVPAALGVASVTCLCVSWGLMKARNAALILSAEAATKAFEEYRARVISDQGPIKDMEYYTGRHVEEIEEIVENPDGSISAEKTIVADDPPFEGPFMDISRDFLWDARSKQFSSSRQNNKSRLKEIQSTANGMLWRNRYLYVADVLKLLGLEYLMEENPEIMSIAQTHGWILDKNDIYGPGLTRVNFGLTNLDDPNMNLFMHGKSDSVILHLNHNGYILNKVWKVFKSDAKNDVFPNCLMSDTNPDLCNNCTSDVCK